VKNPKSMKGDDMSPYEQGYLDGLCGLYSVINAIRLVCKNTTEDECMILLKKIIKNLEKRKKISNIIIEGINEDEIRFILKEVIEPLYPITWERPYRKRKKLTINAFWNGVSTFLKEGNRRAVIVSMETKRWDHWSVIYRITENQMSFFDSSDLKRVYRKRCTAGKRITKQMISFEAREAFFIAQHQ
jgi:hypothetical protein